MPLWRSVWKKCGGKQSSERLLLFLAWNEHSKASERVFDGLVWVTQRNSSK